MGTTPTTSPNRTIVVAIEGGVQEDRKLRPAKAKRRQAHPQIVHGERAWPGLGLLRLCLGLAPFAGVAVTHVHKGLLDRSKVAIHHILAPRLGQTWGGNDVDMCVGGRV